MKSAILPQAHVDPEIRANLESMLRKGETLSEFIEGKVRSAVEYRRTQAECYAPGRGCMAGVRAHGRGASC
ncbi:YlcI/YnfO family protein [Xenophilus azovorans]|uniref:YlcI/YnfO family protein n=1 Tax=Xenophilus azovorans TaxID=151755 RepID=UPI003CCBB305